MVLCYTIQSTNYIFLFCFTPFNQSITLMVLFPTTTKFLLLLDFKEIYNLLKTWLRSLSLNVFGKNKLIQKIIIGFGKKYDYLLRKKRIHGVRGGKKGKKRNFFSVHWGKIWFLKKKGGGAKFQLFWYIQPW